MMQALMLESVFLFTLVGARYLVALFSSIVVLIFYDASLILRNGYHTQFVAYNFFLIGCNAVVLISCYNTELYIRKEFLLKKEAERLARSLRNLNCIRADMSMMLVRQHEEMSSAKTRFVANVSHELRTPLHGIIGMAQALAQSNLDDEQHEFCDIILTSAESLVRITNDILDISKVEQKGTDAFGINLFPRGASPLYRIRNKEVFHCTISRRRC
jgi:signal transduction histidine kinase